MNPDTPLFGRITIGSNRTSLGRSAISTLMIRAMEQIRKARHRDDLVIQIEISPARLPDSTTFDRQALLELQVAEQTVVDPSSESPFPGITVGEVADAMSSPEYEAYAEICDPVKRQGLGQATLEKIQADYVSKFPMCAMHFPRWIP